jgi:uncharacterized protein
MNPISRRTLIAAGLAGACASPARTPGVREESIAFEANGEAMRGTLYLPEQAARAPLLIAYHAANGGSVDFPFYSHLKSDLPGRGVATFLFDRRGINGQPGNFTSATFEDLARDGIGALDTLKRHGAIDAHRIGAWGISQGGWIAPLATTLSDDFGFSIAVSGPGVTPARQMAFAAGYTLREAGYPDAIVARAMELRTRIDAFYRTPADRAALQRDIDAARTEPWFSAAYLPLRSADAQLPENTETSKWQQEMDFDPRITLARVNKPMLAIFGAQDRWVPVEESIAALRESVRPDLLRVWVSPESGHFIAGHAESEDYGGTDPVEAAYLQEIASFIARI